MRRSNVNMPPFAVAFQVAGLVIIAAGLAWILVDGMTRLDPLAARADPPSGRAVIQR